MVGGALIAYGSNEEVVRAESVHREIYQVLATLPLVQEIRQAVGKVRGSNSQLDDHINLRSAQAVLSGSEMSGRAEPLSATLEVRCFIPSALGADLESHT